MRSILILFLLLIIFSCKQDARKMVSMKEDVTYLAADSLMGRETGTSYEMLAGSYLADRFRDLGLEAKGSDGYMQEFTFKPSTNPHQEAEVVDKTVDSTLTGRNVIAYLDNKAPTTVIIGAHYDHLGMGGQGSLYREGEAIHNGADDNASGVAVLLKLAGELKDTNTNNNYLFIAFSGEEMGLLGSNYFVKNPTIDLADVSYMMNMDMVGRLNDENTLAVHGVGTSPVWKQALFANNDLGLNIAEHESGIGPSDHTSFYIMDIPVLHFFTGQHSDYHKPSDDADKLNYTGMETISKYILNIISDLNDNEKLAFRKTKNESEDVPRFKVTLGVVPDYLYTGEGMRIDGVSEDRPAIKAGIQKGDIVKKMGEFEVTDMMSYMKSLSKFEEGQTVMVMIDRDGEMLEMEVTF
ncbi:MAG: M28 family peptidase [Bacteroidia bacterium]|nr:M28 family peptidase [Bacteroidia bacterium]NNF32231.1 M28 family peptidase [Flavobacteriaceae bacterium]MBT8276694.1 M28 family peptidase [Bacteroidia bacterium]NNJ81079.1 M28 family peptidase [Flavobacteriaceae bacterium]NNK55152.1 M28 family peptidase [Flavobacteriaceae bacterium]